MPTLSTISASKSTAITKHREQHPMSNPLEITVEQAVQIVLAERERKGLARPDHHESQDPNVQDILRTLRRTREALGDMVDVLVTLPK